MVEKDNLILDKNLRDKLANRIDVLDNVKKLITLPETDFMTIQQVADYYGVTDKAIKNLVSSNKDEIENDGSSVLKRDYFEKEVKFPFKNNHGSVTYSLPNGQELIVSNRGLRVFPKRAVLRIGMLLTKSEVAKQLRTALLDVVTGEVPVTTTVQDAIMDANDKYIELHTKQYNLIMSGDRDGALLAQADIREYEIRHEKQMQDEIDKLTPKAKAYDRLCDSEYAHEMKDAAKCLNYGRNTLFKKLRNDGYLMSDNTPYQNYVKQGLFELKMKQFGKHTYSVTLMTDKGITYFDKLFNSGKAVNA